MPSGREDNYNGSEEKIKSLFCSVLDDAKQGLPGILEKPCAMLSEEQRLYACSGFEILVAS
jgi:hypothetical protein